MNIRKLVAYKIYEVREEIGLEHNSKHDYWLADKFLQNIGDKTFNDEDIYIWFVQLDENLVEKQTPEEDLYG